jgi:hypothetical protein
VEGRIERTSSAELLSVSVNGLNETVGEIRVRMQNVQLGVAAAHQPGAAAPQDLHSAPEMIEGVMRHQDQADRSKIRSSCGRILRIKIWIDKNLESVAAFDVHAHRAMVGKNHRHSRSLSFLTKFAAKAADRSSRRRRSLCRRGGSAQSLFFSPSQCSSSFILLRPPGRAPYTERSAAVKLFMVVGLL